MERICSLCVPYLKTRTMSVYVIVVRSLGFVFAHQMDPKVRYVKFNTVTNQQKDIGLWGRVVVTTSTIDRLLATALVPYNYYYSYVTLHTH